MTANLAFDEDKSFSDNFESFCAALDDLDAEMAAIFRENISTLNSVVFEGDSDSEARAKFNAAVFDALDAIVTIPEEPEGM